VREWEGKKNNTGGGTTYAAARNMATERATLASVEEAKACTHSSGIRFVKKKKSKGMRRRRRDLEASQRLHREETPGESLHEI